MYKPKYTITDELLRKVAEIEALRTSVDSSYILPEREIELRYRATVEATHSSTSIEGNPLNLKQVQQVLGSSEQLTRHQYAEIEVKNYKKALDFIDKRKNSKKPITVEDIMAIHALVTNHLLPDEKVGKLRQNPIYIADHNDTTVYTGPEADTVGVELDRLLDWLANSRDVHPVIAAGILHFQFVSIHPFADGNGRTTRLLTDLHLGIHDYNFRGSLVLDSYYSVDKAAYYEALSLSDTYGGRRSAILNPWLEYFANGFLSSARLLTAEVVVLSSLAANVTKSKLPADEADILSYARQFGSITLSEAQAILPSMSKRTMQRRLMGLVKNGYLMVQGSARDTRYVWKIKAGQ